MWGRTDHVDKLAKEGTIPKWFRDEKVDDSRSQYASSFKELKKSYGFGATLVTLEDSLKIECIQEEGDLWSSEFSNIEGHLVRENCVPNWPVPLTLVHPVDDYYEMIPHGLLPP
jgi:hypothetical protein